MATEGSIVKMEKDFAAEVDAALAQAEQLAKSSKLQQAIELLLVLEKQTRVGADMISNSRLLVCIVQQCHKAKDYKLLQEQLVALSKKHGLLKQSITKMVQEAVLYLDELKGDQLMEYLTTLLQVTEGKIYVEVERARLTRRLAALHEQEKKFDEAADTLQALQVETFGSMDKREKTDFILEQMRLNLQRRDYIRTHLIARKINIKYFADEGTSDLKMRYYTLMIEWALHDSQYLKVSQFQQQIYDTLTKKPEDQAQALEVLKLVVVFCVLAAHDHEQSDLLHRTASQDADRKHLPHIPLYAQLLKSFSTMELIRWPSLEQVYGKELKQLQVFQGEAGQKRWLDLHTRTMEHNIRVIAEYYSSITSARLCQLLDLSAEESELTLSRLVSAKVIHARIDRIDGVVTFQRKRNPTQVIQEWQGKVHQLLDIVARTTHLIAKEEMVSKMAQK